MYLCSQFLIHLPFLESKSMILMRLLGQRDDPLESLFIVLVVGSVVEMSTLLLWQANGKVYHSTRALYQRDMQTLFVVSGTS